MRKEDYFEIMKQNLNKSVTKLKLGCNCVFQQNNDPKHTSNVGTKWLQRQQQSESIGVAGHDKIPDLNPIESLWTAVKYRV